MNFTSEYTSSKPSCNCQSYTSSSTTYHNIQQNKRDDTSDCQINTNILDKYLTTNLDNVKSDFLFKKREITCQSAFENDSDVLLYKNTTECTMENSNNNSSNNDSSGKPPLSAVTKKYLSYNNFHLDNNFVNPTSSGESKINQENTEQRCTLNSDRAYETKFENDYLNIFSLKLKKEEKENEKKAKTGIEIPIYFQKEEETRGGQFDNSITDTIESTHMDSDYAKGPVFPSDAYGSRPSSKPSRSTGIYHRRSGKESFRSSSLNEVERKAASKKEKSPEKSPPASILKSKSKRKTEERKEIYLSEDKLNQFCEESSVLDPECLKLMDKKLKKLMKKSAKESSKRKSASNHNLENNLPATWDVPWKMKLNNDSEINIESSGNMNNYCRNDRVSNETMESAFTQSFLTNSCPYLPLKDVPVHDLVKKLRHEFEQSGDVSSLNAGLDNLWQK
jgi:hypothetical protein